MIVLQRLFGPTLLTTVKKGRAIQNKIKKVAIRGFNGKQMPY